jgi:hypothetical protein
MGEETICVVIRAMDRFSASVKVAHESLRRMVWLLWWLDWGTDGWKRRTALVTTAAAPRDET